MLKEQQNSNKDIKPTKEALLTKNRTKIKPAGEATRQSESHADSTEQILALLRSHREQDVLVCFKDKKTKQLRLFSSEPASLSIEQLKISKKTEMLHKFELAELVSKLKSTAKSEQAASGGVIKQDLVAGKELKAKDLSQKEKEVDEKVAEKHTD